MNRETDSEDEPDEEQDMMPQDDETEEEDSDDYDDNEGSDIEHPKPGEQAVWEDKNLVEHEY